MSILLAAALLALPQAGPASSGPGCVLDTVPASDRPELVRDTLAGTETAVTDRLDAAVDRCAAHHDWTPHQAGAFAAWAVAILLRDDADARLRRTPIAVDVIDQWFAQQSPEVQTNLDFGEEVMGSLLAALLANGASEALLDAQGETIGVYLGARVMIERAQRGLSLS